MQDRDFLLEWRLPTDSDWTELDEDLKNDLPDAQNEPFRYRLRQKYYAYACPLALGTREWAQYQMLYGNKCIELPNGKWELVPIELVLK
jgi:hypothetical protein